MTDKPEQAVLDKIATLEPHEEVALRLHHLILESAPDLVARLWYGMPGYAKSKSDPVIVFFRVDDGHMTFGITEKADLTPDANAPHQLIESAWFVNGLDDPTETRIAEIVTRAAR